MALDDELARLSLLSRPRTMLHDRSWTERRDIMIEQRIKALERNRKHLPPEKKWPTAKSVRLHQEAKLQPGPVVSITQATPHKVKGKTPAIRPRADYLAELVAPSTSPRSEFPFPLTSNKRGPSFTCFSSLPTELRLQIWEDALISEVKFIEVQYSSQIHGTTFFHTFPQTSILDSICRESRALALFFKNRPPSPQLTRLLLHRGQDVDDKRGQSLRFNPEQDTIFLRSLDQPFGIGGLLEFSHRVSKIQRIQHLALPLSPAYLPPNNEWKRAISNFRDLKTLTYVVGDMNQWVGRKYAQLRDVEEWFRDGRERRFECDFLCLDVRDVGRYLSGAKCEKRLNASYGWRLPYDWKGLNVRVVAWKRVVG